jgi:hypothetical protein
LYMLYGSSMGLFRGSGASVISGFKLPFLYLLTLLVCFPPFYVLNCLDGPRLGVRQGVRLLLIAASANAVALASYTPVSDFITLTTSQSGYTFLVLMHVIVFAVSAILSLVVVALVFRATAAKLGYRLRPGVLATWALLYALVGTQMSWVLRPWVGTASQSYTLFRARGGSFIEMLWNLVVR